MCTCALYNRTSSWHVPPLTRCYVSGIGVGNVYITKVPVLNIIILCSPPALNFHKINWESGLFEEWPSMTSHRFECTVYLFSCEPSPHWHRLEKNISIIPSVLVHCSPHEMLHVHCCTVDHASHSLLVCFTNGADHASHSLLVCFTNGAHMSRISTDVCCSMRSIKLQRVPVIPSIPRGINWQTLSLLSPKKTVTVTRGMLVAPESTSPVTSTASDDVWNTMFHINE